jgi:pimeloyl-ACP methyl ester carboxylesterase
MGGMNAIRYAARHSARLAALIVVDIAPVIMQAGLIEMEEFRQDTETMRRFEDFLERAVHFNPQRKPDHLRYSLLHSLKPVEDGWTWKQDHRRRPVPSDITKERIQEPRQVRADAMWTDVRAIETPTLLMRGAVSKILSPEAAKQTVEAMPDCEQVVVEGAGHSVQGDNPKDFAAELDAYVTRRGLVDR